MTAKRSNGAERAPTPMSVFAAMWQPSEANPFMMSQRLALEAARFWARRMHAYADQMEKLAACSSPEQVASANTRFIERLREDYVEETSAFRELIAPPGQEEQRTDN